MTTIKELTKWSGVALAIPHEPISEDLVRASLIDAIELCKQAYKGQWFDMNQAAKLIHIHIEDRLNRELKALLVGDIEYYRRAR